MCTVVLMIKPSSFISLARLDGSLLPNPNDESPWKRGMKAAHQMYGSDYDKEPFVTKPQIRHNFEARIGLAEIRPTDKSKIDPNAPVHEQEAQAELGDLEAVLVSNLESNFSIHALELQRSMVMNPHYLRELAANYAARICHEFNVKLERDLNDYFVRILNENGQKDTRGTGGGGAALSIGTGPRDSGD